MEKILIRKVVSEWVETPMKYPLYRKAYMGDHVNYWKFINKTDAVLLIQEGIRTTILQYTNCSTDTTPLTAQLLDASTTDIQIISKDDFERVRNAIVVDLCKL